MAQNGSRALSELFGIKRGTNSLCAFLYRVPGTEHPHRSHIAVGILYNGRVIVLGKNYFTKQASILLEFARSTSNPQLSAKLVSKAADLKSQADPLPEKDQSLRAPDVDPHDETGAT